MGELISKKNRNTIMKKTVYTIGRDVSCDICLYDPDSMVSRHHAVLKVKKNGRYVIVDYSLNGTYVNGVRILSEREVPVSRKDVVSFANAVNLDWSLVPRPSVKKPVIIITLCIVAVIVPAVLMLLYDTSRTGTSGNGRVPDMEVAFPQDSSSRARPETGDGKPIFRRTLPGLEKERDAGNRHDEMVDTVAVSDSIVAGQDSSGISSPAASDTILVSIPDTTSTEPVDSAAERNINAIY